MRGELLLDPDELDAAERFDEEVEQASEGDWAALGIDPPRFDQPATIEDLRNGT